MKKITSILLSTLVLVALPAGCASKKKNSTKAKAEHEVTINNEIDVIEIHKVDEASALQDDTPIIADHEDVETENINKF